MVDVAPTGERGRRTAVAANTSDPKKKGRGRPKVWPHSKMQKFTPDLACAILEKLRRGNYLEVSAAAAGVSKKTLCQWLKMGRAAGHGPVWQFTQDVKIAQAEAEAGAVANVQKSADAGIWQSAAWLLERRHPKRWAKRERVEHTGKDGGPLTTADATPFASLTSEQRIARLAQLEAEAKRRAEANGPDEPGSPERPKQG